MILCPMKQNTGLSFAQKLEDLKQQGITRIEINDEMLKLEEAIIRYSPESGDAVNIVIDRITVVADEDSKSRFADSAQMAFRLGDGICIIKTVDENPRSVYSAMPLKKTVSVLKSPPCICSALTIPSGPVRFVKDTER